MLVLERQVQRLLQHLAARHLVPCSSLPKEQTVHSEAKRQGKQDPVPHSLLLGSKMALLLVSLLRKTRQLLKGALPILC